MKFSISYKHLGTTDLAYTSQQMKKEGLGCDTRSFPTVQARSRNVGDLAINRFGVLLHFGSVLGSELIKIPAEFFATNMRAVEYFCIP